MKLRADTFVSIAPAGVLFSWALLKNRQVERQVESQVERRVERQVKALLDDSALPDDFSLPDDDDFSIL